MEKHACAGLAGFAATFALAVAFISLPRPARAACPTTDSSQASIEGVIWATTAAEKVGHFLGNSCPAVPAKYPFHLAEPGAWPKSACHPEYTLKSVCSAASDYCGSSTRSDGISGGCWFGLGSPAKCEPEGSLLVGDKKVFEYAAAKFKSILGDPAMQTHCCGTNADCLKAWPKTKLMVDLGLGADDLTGYFGNAADDTAIHVSTGTLVNCTAKDCVDRLFLHELGHACHFWHYNSMGSDGKPVAPQNFLPRPIADAKRDLDSILGADAEKCVVDSLTKLRDRENALPATDKSRVSNIDFNEWIEEATADSTFVTSWTEPGTWGWNCNSLTDSEHGDPKTYQGCYLSNPEVKRAICGTG